MLPIWGKWAFVIVKNFTILLSSFCLSAFCTLFLCAQCSKCMYLFYPYDNPIRSFFQFIERKTADLSYWGPFNRKLPGFKPRLFLFSSLVLEAGWCLSEGTAYWGFSCPSYYWPFFRHLFPFFLWWRIRDIPTTSALGGLFWVYSTGVWGHLLSYCLSLAKGPRNITGVIAMESPRYQVKWILRQSTCVWHKVEGEKCFQHGVIYHAPLPPPPFKERI